MFLIQNRHFQIFSSLKPNLGKELECWESAINYDHNLPMNITIFPSEFMAQQTINNILAFRSDLNNKEELKVVPFSEYFKGKI